VLVPTYEPIGVRSHLLADCPIDHWTSDCFRQLSGGESALLWSAAVSMSLSDPSSNCYGLGQYIEGNIGLATIVHGPIQDPNSGTWATGDSHGTTWHPGAGAGRFHAADSSWYQSQKIDRMFTGPGGMLSSLVHEYVHKYMGWGQDREADAAALTSYCLGW